MKSLSLFVAIAFLLGAVNLPMTSIDLPEGSAGIGFDDLRYSANMNKILAPAGRTGMLDLIDARTHEITPISGFTSQKEYGRGHGEGITSVDEGNGVLFVVDRSAQKLAVVDPSSKKIVTSSKLASSPDYVRFVSAAGEIWVTEPDSDRIETFKFSKTETPPAHSGFIETKGGPEALVVDAQRGRAYTHLWKGKTLAIDLKSKEIVAVWKNSCDGSRGLVMDDAGKFLFVGCAEGKAVVLDPVHDGRVVSNVSSGNGVDIIDYNPKLRHLYLPGARSATMAIIKVSETGMLTLAATIPTVEGAHCVVSDREDEAYICDPHHGKLLLFRDQ